MARRTRPCGVIQPEKRAVSAGRLSPMRNLYLVDPHLCQLHEVALATDAEELITQLSN